MYDWQTDPSLSNGWKRTFSIIEKYGLNGIKDPEGYKSISFWEKTKANSNVWAFLFGPIYFLFKGMFRIALSLLLIILVINVICNIIAHAVGFDGPAGIGSFVSALTSLETANYAYYNYKVRGYRGWNPFHAMSKKAVMAGRIEI